MLEKLTNILQKLSKIKKVKTIRKRKNVTTIGMTGRTIKRQSTKKMYVLAAKGDYNGANKVELEEHNRTKKKIIDVSESMANAVVEAEQEFFIMKEN